MDGGRTFRKSPRIVERRIRGEHVLVPVAGTAEQISAIYALNETAGLVWDQAVRGLTEDQMVDAVRTAYEVDETKAKHDVALVLEELCAMGALEPNR